MSTATFFNFMSTRGFLDAGIYKCDVVYTNSTNEEFLSNQSCERVADFAKECQGVLQVRNVTNPVPEQIRYEEIYGFVNKESLFRFAQNVGFVKSTHAFDFQVDFASLQLLI